MMKPKKTNPNSRYATPNDIDSGIKRKAIYQ
jgi:hypothetical protein